MTDFPSDLETQRPVSQMQTDLENFLDATRELLSGSFSNATPSGTALSVSASVTYVQGAGGATTVSSISSSLLENSRGMLLISPHSSGSALPLTIQHGAGTISLRGSVDMVMTVSRESLLLRNVGGGWYEVARFETNEAGMQAYLNLGSAAYADVGDFLGPADTAGDSTLWAGDAQGHANGADADTVDTFHGAEFARLTDPAEQVFIGDIKTSGGLLSIHHATQDPLIRWWRGLDDIGIMGLEPGNDLYMRLQDPAGALVGTLRIDQATGDLLYRNDLEGGANLILTPGKSDAATLGGKVPAEFETVEIGLDNTVVQTWGSNGIGVAVAGTDHAIPRTATYLIEGVFLFDMNNQTGNPHTVTLAVDGVALSQSPGLTVNDTWDGNPGLVIVRFKVITPLTIGEVVQYYAGRTSQSSRNVYGGSVYDEQAVNVGTIVPVPRTHYTIREVQ